MLPYGLVVMAQQRKTRNGNQLALACGPLIDDGYVQRLVRLSVDENEVLLDQEWQTAVILWTRKIVDGCTNGFRMMPPLERKRS